MDDPHLDEVATQWSLLRLAHSADVASTADARQALLLRYRGAIRGYVLALLRNEADADDVAQDVFLRLMRGDFAGADPSRGRFRDLLKVSIKNMVRSHWDRSKRHATKSADVSFAEDETENRSDLDQWDEHWRQQLLDAAWNSLREQQAVASGDIAYSVLRLRSENPDDDSERLAQRLSQATGQPWRADAFRQQLRRARLRFAQLLIEELARSLPRATPENVEAELIDLGLIEFVRPFLPADWQAHGELRESG